MPVFDNLAFWKMIFIYPIIESTPKSTSLLLCH